jgi:hypothetical protein
MKSLNLVQRKLNKHEVRFLVWFLTKTQDNPVFNNPRNTIWKENQDEYTEKDFISITNRLKNILKSYQ